MSKYYRPDAYMAIKNEQSLRNPEGTKDAATATVYALDKQINDEVPFFASELKREREHSLGSGTRNADQISELGYEAVRESTEHKFQTGKLPHLAAGACSTAGTSYGTPKTDTVASGGGTAILTLTGGGLTPDAHIGDMMEVTIGDNVGNKYEIIDNDASTLTLDITTPANIDADTIEIKTAPFVHTITEQNTIASHQTTTIHAEKENATDAESVRNDLLGCLADNWRMVSEAPGQAEAEQTVDWVSAKTRDGTDIARPTTLDTRDAFKWCDVKTLNLAYNSANLLDNTNPSRVELEIANNIDMPHEFGDCYPDHFKMGEREHTVTIQCTPETRDLYDLHKTPVESFLTDLDLTVLFTQAGGSYSTAVTDVVQSVSGAVITLTTGGLGVDAYIGDWVVITAGDNVGKRYYITDNDASTITVDEQLPASLAGDSLEVKWAWYAQFAYDKLYIDEYPGKIPSKDDMEEIVDMVLKQGARSGTTGSLAITTQDSLGVAHYEGSTTS